MIDKKKKHILRLCLGITCAVTIASTNILAYAKPSSKELKNKTVELQNEINNLNNELTSLGKEIEEKSSEIETLAAEAEQTKLDLAAAKLNEEAQYAAMKERIKFMYEGGSISLLTIVFSSESMSDFLNNAEYVATISEYDRNMLDNLRAVRTDVEEKQASLENKQNEIASLTEELKEKQNTLTSKVASASSELADYNAQLEHAKAAEAAAALAQNNEVSASTSSKNTSADKNTSANNSNHGTSSVPANTSDVALLAAVLQLESGASYDGMLAVGTVIMNRVRSSSFPNTIPGVIYQKNQFYDKGNAALNNVLSKGPSSSAYAAAQAVIGGSRHPSVSNCYFFYSDWYAEKLGVSGVNVAGNVFFQSYPK